MPRPGSRRCATWRDARPQSPQPRRKRVLPDTSVRTVCSRGVECSMLPVIPGSLHRYANLDRQKNQVRGESVREPGPNLPRRGLPLVRMNGVRGDPRHPPSEIELRRAREKAQGPRDLQEDLAGNVVSRARVEVPSPAIPPSDRKVSIEQRPEGFAIVRATTRSSQLASSFDGEFVIRPIQCCKGGESLHAGQKNGKLRRGAVRRRLVSWLPARSAGRARG